MKKTLALFVSIVALGTALYAGNGGGCQMMDGGMAGPGMMNSKGGMMRSNMFDQLNLSDDQRHQLDILHSEMRTEMTKLHDPKSMRKMQDFLSGDTFNKKEFVKTQNEMHAKMVALQADHMEKVFNILTKDQREQLKKLLAEKPVRQPKPAPMAPAGAPAPTPEAK